MLGSDRPWRSTAVHLVVITVLGIPLITPLLNWSSVPCTHDGHLHYHRIAAMRFAWDNGLLFSRWLPDLAFGYGYPFFVFREAAPLYMSLVPHTLGLPLPAAINLFYLLSILAAGWFMYLWVRDIFGPRSGIVSAVAYMAAPYLFIDALVRGNQPESMALALFPLLCWAGRRFIVRGSGAYFVIATVGLAILALSHNISLLLFVPFLFIYLIAVSWMERLGWKPAVIRVGLLFGLGLGLSAFYLGPALLELDEITISQSISTRNNDFRFNFASLGEIMAPVRPADPTLLNPPLLIRLGWVPFVLALLGIISLVWTRARERRGHIIFMILSTVLLLFMALSVSLPLWERLPLIEFVQFPWRFVGRAALPVAFLAGVPFAHLPQAWRFWGRDLPLAPVVTVVAVSLLLLEALPNLYPHICREEPRPTINSVHAYERETGLVGVDPEGSYFPKSVISRPKGSLLEEDYQAGRQPQRFDEEAIPAGASIDFVEYSPLSGRIGLDTPSAFQARYLSFTFPGWVAKVDGEAVPITASDPEGLITFHVPEGEHTIEVSWRMTPIRGLLTAVSVASLILVASIALVLFIRRPKSELSATSSTGDEAAPSGPVQGDGSSSKVDTPGGDASSTAARGAMMPVLVLLLVAGISFLLLKVLVIDRVDTPFHRPAQPSLDDVTGITSGELILEGYNLGRGMVDSGGHIDIDMTWRVIEPPTADYQSNVWLVGPEGMIWSDKETPRPRLYEDTAPTRFWLPGQWAWDSREVNVLPGTPPGRYDITLILFDLDTLHPQTLFGQDGVELGPATIIGTVEVTLPGSTPTFDPQYVINKEISGLTLLGYNQDRKEASPGDPLLLTLFWERTGELASSLDELRLVLSDDSGIPVQSWQIPPVRADHPPDHWPTGMGFRGQHALRLTPELEGGVYNLQLEDIYLGSLNVEFLDRLYEEPEVEIPIGATFGEEAALLGVSIEPVGIIPGAPLTVTLVWSAREEMPVSYRAFVHLVDDSGVIVDQSDAEPGAWSRPTTGWLPGEFVIDPHYLAPPVGLSDDNLTLRIGLYDPATGHRLSTADDDFVLIDVGLGVR